MVALHHGTISVESTLGIGSCFTVELPIDKEAYLPVERMDETPSEEVEEAIPEGNAADKSAILLVDDNTELLYVMTGIFRNKFQVITATNGQQAWEKLRDYAIDLVISDVMMPDMDGWQLCRRIKSDLRYNHIPVVILTAKQEADDQVASYEAGADGYMAKPFESKVLFARVDNLLKSYQVRQKAFQREENIDLEGLSYPSSDKLFLQSIIDSIEQHLDEPEFDLELLSTEQGMSKSTLYRKIKSMTGLTPLDFIRNVKMKRACMMLLTQRQNISEIAYSVGFSNPKYFSKCFKEEFGVTPSEYQNRVI